MEDGIRLDGKVAVITGAAGDIGLATAKLMAYRGALIVAVDLPTANLRVVRDALGATVHIVAGDVTDEEFVRHYVDEATRSFTGNIDIFFNNAGIEGPVASVQDVDLDDFRRIMTVNVEGVFLGMKHVVPVMLKQGSGAIINSSSLGGLGGAPGMIAYNTSKHAVIGMTRVVAMEVARQGIRVNCVNPGPIAGRMISSIDERAGANGKVRIDAIPAGRYGTAREVAALVCFLASDDASYITGAFNTVDGGRYGRT